MKQPEKAIWDICFTLIAFIIFYSLFVAILGGFFVLFRVTYDSIWDFVLYATVFFTIRFVTDWIFHQTSTLAVKRVKQVPIAVIVQMMTSSILHLIIIYSLGSIVTVLTVPVHVQIALAIGCSFIEVVRNGKWKEIEK